MQNVYLQQPLDEPYRLQVELLEGEPVEFQVLLQWSGFPQMVYKLPPHEHLGQLLEVFLVNSCLENVGNTCSELA